MTLDGLVIGYLLVTAAALLLSYVIVRLAVKHGTATALRDHELWLRDGSVERELDEHVRSVAAARMRK